MALRAIGSCLTQSLIALGRILSHWIPHPHRYHHADHKDENVGTGGKNEGKTHSPIEGVWVVTQLLGGPTTKKCSMSGKNHHPKRESIPSHSLSRQTWLNLWLLAFKASRMSTAPLVLCCTSRGSWIWHGVEQEWIIWISPSKTHLLTLKKVLIQIYVYFVSAR